MAMPKKGSRPITVDSIEYRWRVRRRPTYTEGVGWSNLTYAVEKAGARGCVLVVETPHPHLNAWIRIVPDAPVTPAAIADAIRQGLAAGWKPNEPGKPFEMVTDTPATPRSEAV